MLVKESEEIKLAKIIPTIPVVEVLVVFISKVAVDLSAQVSSLPRISRNH